MMEPKNATTKNISARNMRNRTYNTDMGAEIYLILLKNGMNLILLKAMSAQSDAKQIPSYGNLKAKGVPSAEYGS